MQAEEANINTNDMHDMAAAFDSLIAPAIVMPGTRVRYFAQWRTQATFAWSLDTLDNLLPLQQELLKAFVLAAIVSAAVCAGIPHDLCCMQTGHKSSAWQQYFDLADRGELYCFFGIFGL